MTAGEPCPKTVEVKKTEQECSKCGSKSGQLKHGTDGGAAVIVCLECDYCSLDDHGESGNGALEDTDVDQAAFDEPSEKSVQSGKVNSDGDGLTNKHGAEVLTVLKNGENETSDVDKVAFRPGCASKDVVKCNVCGNKEVEILEEKCVGKGSVKKMRCPNCDEAKESHERDSNWSIKCDDCGNHIEHWFHRIDCNAAGYALACLICLKIWRRDGEAPLDFLERRKRVEAENQSRLGAGGAISQEAPKRTHARVKDLSQLHCGDHIAWDRDYLVWHHAIVTSVDPTAGKITVIHNSGGIKDMPNRRIASVRVETIEVDCDYDLLYVFEYDDSECYSPEEVLERATQRLDEGYDPLTNNCEHFARWCKTGLNCSLQRKNFEDRLKMGASGFAKVIEESLMTAIRFFGNCEPMNEILGIGSKSGWAVIEARFGWGGRDSMTMFHSLQLGAVLFGIALAIMAEIIFFCCKVYDAKKETDANDMPADVFKRCIIQLYWEGLTGLGAGSLAAFGMSLVPYAGPIISPIGYVLGNWIGRVIGALIGRLVVRILYRLNILRE